MFNIEESLNEYLRPRLKTKQIQLELYPAVIK